MWLDSLHWLWWDKDISNLLRFTANLATTLGIPIFIYQQIKYQRRERELDEYNAFDSLAKEYREFQKISVENPDLDIGDCRLSQAGSLSESENVKRKNLYLILISTLERAYLLYRRKSAKVRAKEWSGWDEYINLYLDRPGFVDAFFNDTAPSMHTRSLFNPDFDLYMKRKFAVRGLIPAEEPAGSNNHAEGLMAQARYTNLAIILHWVIALAIAANVLLAWLWPHSLPDDAVRPAIDFHKSLGVTVFGLALLRILWRFGHPPPPMPSAYQKWEIFAAHTAHILLYVIMFAMPLTGWLMDSAWKDAASHPMHYFGAFEFPRFGPFMGASLDEKKKLHDIFGEAHELFSYLFYALFIAHVGGALKHQILDREPELARMGIGKSNKDA